MTNKTLFACSWVSSVVAFITLNLSPFWEFIISLAPWASTAIYYLINFDKVNDKVVKIIAKIKRTVKWKK